MNELVEKLKEEFKGYHIALEIYPAGGMIEVTGCEECGTDDCFYENSRWRFKHPRLKTIDDAVVNLKEKLGAL